MKKGTVFLKGGFGNQLFQLAFANYLSCNDYIVNLNTDLFKKNNQDTPRKLVLPIEYFDFKEQRKLSKYIFNLNHRLESSELTRKTNLNYFFKNYKFTKEKNFNIEKSSKLTFFNGYWKEVKYAEFSKEFIRESLKKNDSIRESFDIENNKVLIHVRRTDFIANNWHLNENFYKESLELMRDKVGEFQFDVFTDDSDWVKSKKIFNEAQTIYYQNYLKDNNEQKDNISDTLSTFSKMLQYKHFIVGNSSFAFWPAFLKDSQDSISIVPTPWFRDNYNHPVLKKDSWLTVKNL